MAYRKSKDRQHAPLERSGDAERLRRARTGTPPPTDPTRQITALPRIELLVAGLVLAGVFVWLYYPTILELVRAWERQPDYSHGWLVAPVALLLLWLRREHFPRDSRVPGWGGLSLIAIGIAVEAAGIRFSLSPLSGWALIFWIGGVCWVVCGRRVFVWALPAILFLFFMVPLPFRMESWLSGPLQRVATILSSWTLQILGLPAVAAGHTIYLGDYQLEIEQACSGLRMLVGIAALVYVLLVARPRSWWMRIALVLGALPVALTANVLRIVVTGLLYQYVSGEAGQRFSHDVAGWLMIPVAASLLGCLIWYLNRLVVEEVSLEGVELLRKA